MPDIAIAWDPLHFRGDWSVSAGDLALDAGGLRSAVLLSLFTDRRASSDYVPPAGDPPDRRGWWGDTYESALLGSRLWQLNRAKKTDSVALRNRAADYCREALQWLLDDGIAQSVTVNVTWLTPQTLAIAVAILKPLDAQPVLFRFDWAWQGA